MTVSAGRLAEMRIDCRGRGASIASWWMLVVRGIVSRLARQQCGRGGGRMSRRGNDSCQLFMRHGSFLTAIKNYAGPTRMERDTIGEIPVPVDCLWGAQTQR